ncbi:Phosphotransferase enzyme family protein [compost metagenome]
MGCRCDLPWLPKVDEAYIAEMIGGRWRPAWEEAKQNPDFTGTFGTEIITAIEDAAVHIVKDMEPVIADTATFTMIHNDLNPGNVLVHDNREVYFIDWEEARYGSLFMDIPLRCGNRKQAEDYRGYLGFFGCEIPQARFAKLYSIASRYLGLRFMGWNLREWQHNEQARHGLIKYMEMVTYPLFG